MRKNTYHREEILTEIEIPYIKYVCDICGIEVEVKEENMFNRPTLSGRLSYIKEVCSPKCLKEAMLLKNQTNIIKIEMSDAKKFIKYLETGVNVKFGGY